MNTDITIAEVLEVIDWTLDQSDPRDWHRTLVDVRAKLRVLQLLRAEKPYTPTLRPTA